MVRSLTEQEIDIKISQTGKSITRAGPYPGNLKKKARFRHNNESCNFHEWTTSTNVIVKGGNCPKCSIYTQLTNKSIDQRLILLEKTDIKRLDPYPGYNKTPIRWQHQNESCGFNIWLAATNDILNHDQGCPKCARDQFRLTTKEVDQRLLEMKQGLIMMDEYPGNTYQKINFLHDCEDCDYYQWQSSTTNILDRDVNCPKCVCGKNERLVGNLLKENGFIVETPKWISYFNMKGDKKRMRPDFYLPQINTYIEYNGAQHYQPVCFGGVEQSIAESNFIIQQERDTILQKYCDDNNIGLIWIDGRKYKNNELIKYVNEDLIIILNNIISN